MSWQDNPQWTADTPAGPLDITINLTKPEKDPRAIAAAAAVRDTGTCDLCWELDAAGTSPADRAGGDAGFRAGETCVGGGMSARLLHGDDPARTVMLQGEPWAWWFSPYGYFPEHLIVAAPDHRPMAITHKTIGCLLDFADAYPQYFIGSNADLPIVGGSILSHDHYQGGRYRFSLMDAPMDRPFALSELPQVSVGIVRWPASVVRLRSADRVSLAAAACRIMDAWRSHNDEACGIRAFTEETDGSRTPHNTLNPILWREGDHYVLDLVLRNNRTTPERPYGLFHPDESLFHIKKENIGLIEIMGRAILPARLASELPGIKDEASRAFYQVLQATGVFKQDEIGRAGWDRFLGRLG